MKNIYLSLLIIFVLSIGNQAYGQAPDSAATPESDNRSFFKKLMEDGSVTIKIDPAPSPIKEIDDSSKRKFESGEIKFDCFWSCSINFNRPRLAKLYSEKQWVDLSNMVIDVGFDSDLSYYYLGYSAEMLGHFKAAETYYKLGQKSENKCYGERMNLCNGINLPSEFNVRIQASATKNYAKNNNIPLNMAESSMAAEKRNIRISRSKSVSSDGKISTGEKDPNGELIKLRCNISGNFLISSANWDVFIDTINGRIKMQWVGGTDTISQLNTKPFEEEIDLMINDNFPPSYMGLIQTGPRTAISYVITRPEFRIILADTGTNTRSPWGQCVKR